MKIDKQHFFRTVASHTVRYLGPAGRVRRHSDAEVIEAWNNFRNNGAIQRMPALFSTGTTKESIKFSNGDVYTHKPYTNYRKVKLPGKEGSIFIAETNYGEQWWYHVDVL